MKKIVAVILSFSTIFYFGSGAFANNSNHQGDQSIGALVEPDVEQTQIFNKYNQGFFVGFSKVSATCQAKGDNVIVFTEDAQVQGLYGQKLESGYMLFASTTTGVFTSSDTGKTWTFLSDVFYDVEDPEDNDPTGVLFFSITTENQDYVAGTRTALFTSNNGGVTWSKRTRGLPDDVPYFALIYDTTEGTSERDAKKYLATGAGLYYIQDQLTRSWNSVNDGMPFIPPNPAPVYDIALIPDSTVFLATAFGPFKGVVSDNEEQFSWQPILRGDITFTTVDKDSIDYMSFILTKDYGNYSIGTNSHIFVMDSISGAMWATSPTQDSLNNLVIEINDNNMYFDGIFISDYSTLNPLVMSMAISLGSATTQIERSENGIIYISGDDGIVKINIDGSTTNLADTLLVNSLFLDDNVLLAGTSTGLYKTDLSNINWVKITSKIDDGYGVDQIDYDVRSILKSPSGNYFLGCYLGGILEGKDTMWDQRNLGLTFRVVENEDIDRIVNSFDNSTAADTTIGIYDKTTQYFGSVTDVDGLDKIFILITDIIDIFYLDAGNGTDYIYSLFDSTDQQLKTANNNSNQRDIIYLDNYPVNLTDYNDAEASIVHALVRMILYNHDPDEEEWLAEGFAMWARWVNGYKFYSNPDESAYIDLGRPRSTILSYAGLKPAARNNILRWGDVSLIKDERLTSFIFFDFIFEKYLQDSTAVQQLVQDTVNGIESVEKLLGGKSFKEVYTDWSLAIHLDALETQYESGNFSFSNIDVTPSTLPFDWGLLLSPPYSYRFPGWAYYYYPSKGWVDGSNNSPELDSAYVFNGDDISGYTVFMIEQNNAKIELSDSIKVTKITLDDYNRGIYVPDFKTSENDDSPFPYISLLVNSNEPMTADGGGITIHNDVEVPDKFSFYPLQNDLLESYYDFYVFCSEQTYMDGGQAELLEEGEEGPEILAINGTDTMQFALTSFFTNDNDIFVYHAFFNLNALMTAAGGSIDFIANGEDRSGNKISLTQGPLLYKQVMPNQPVSLSNKEETVLLELNSGVESKTLLTLFTLNKEDAANFEESVNLEQIGNTYIIGPVGKKIENSSILISYENLNFTGDEENLGIYRKESDEWIYLESKIDKINKKVSAEISKFGQFRVQYGNIESEIVDNVPKVFALNQNYPNPFNPLTTIKYQIPKDNHVTLTIFNILGQKIIKLVDKFQKAGYYKYTFNINSGIDNLSSGIYFYSIEAENFRATRKMILIK